MLYFSSGFSRSFEIFEAICKLKLKLLCSVSEEFKSFMVNKYGQNLLFYVDKALMETLTEIKRY
jgi:hypothetical protein